MIDERFDLDLLAGAAELRPNWQFNIIGPVVKIDAGTLPQRSNIHWGGPCAYADLPQQIGTWDVGIMPFALNEATRFISPTKTPEFLAAGVPVVSTPIIDVVRSYGSQGLVEIASTPEELVAAAEHVMARPKGDWLAAVDRALAAGSWDSTWADMHGLMRAARGATGRTSIGIADPIAALASRTQAPSRSGPRRSDPIAGTYKEFTVRV